MAGSALRSPVIEQARYTGLTPAAFGACFITYDGRPRSADWARRLIDRGLLAAMDTNPGGRQRRDQRQENRQDEVCRCPHRGF